MKITDAAKILDLNGEINPETVKVAYRRACKKYHPDTNKDTASTEMMKAVNAAYAVLKEYEGNVEQGAEGYCDALKEAIDSVIALNMPNTSIEVCGAWLWVSGETKPYSKQLGKNGIGLFWASKKKMWYFRPEDWKSSSRGNLTMDEIREKHGSIMAKSTNTRKYLKGVAA